VCVCVCVVLLLVVGGLHKGLGGRWINFNQQSSKNACC
jgi:hypothetical protein